jgi:5-methylcytosine-specific restriction endonuclease McrA
MSRTAKLRAKLDKLARESLLEREHQCYTCSVMPTDVSHLLSKAAFPALRWDVRNIHMQCRECHSRHHTGDGSYHDEWIRRNGKEAYEQLRADGRKRMSYQEMLDVMGSFTV